jgi:hypothetical protein
VPAYLSQAQAAGPRLEEEPAAILLHVDELRRHRPCEAVVGVRRQREPRLLCGPTLHLRHLVLLLRRLRMRRRGATPLRLHRDALGICFILLIKRQISNFEPGKNRDYLVPLA